MKGTLTSDKGPLIFLKTKERDNDLDFVFLIHQYDCILLVIFLCTLVSYMSDVGHELVD